MATEPGTSLRELFDRVIELPPDQREAALRSRTADEAVVNEVLALCVAADRTFTARVHAARDAMVESVASPPLAVGESLGPWRIVGEIGRGGMGLVYRVERSDGHYTQTAALKFIAGVPAGERLAHFTRERQLLAKLSHPHIARLLDGGATADGRPYLVMEYIEGAHIDRWCREQRLEIRAVLQLFLKCCEAVAFAHRQLVVHCDLKPSNLLVDANGRVVLLDFGVARLAERGEAADAAPSGGYTPAYASPELREGATVSTASDIYSLGVVLAELLRAASGVVPPALVAIAAKARSEETARRYGTVEALVADITRWFRREPVDAVDGGVWYRTRCFVRRHAVPVSLTAGLVLALVAGLIVNLQSLSRAERERLRAERTADFLGNVLSAVDPARARDLDKTLMREVLDQAARSAQQELADEPLVLATVERVIGNTYAAIAEYETALEHLTSAHALVPTTAARERLALRMDMAGAKSGMEHSVEAVAAMETLVHEYESAFGARDPDTLRARVALIEEIARQGDYRRTEAMSVALQPQLEQHLGAEDPAIWQNQRWLTVALSELGHYERAEQAYFLLIERLRSQFGADDRRTLGVQGGLSIHYLRNARYDKAELLLKDLYPRALRAQGEGSTDAIQYGSALGSALRLGGKVAESEPWYRQALEQSRALHGPDSAATVRYEQNFANLEIDLGKPAEALARIERVAPLVAKQRGERSQPMLEAWRTRGRAYTALGRVAEARQAWSTSLAIGGEIFGSEDHAMLREDRDALAALEGKTAERAAKPTP